MTTILHTLAHDVAAADGLDPISVSEDELTLFGSPLLRNWWRADIGFGTFGWSCIKTGRRLLPERTAMPTLTTMAAHNNREALIFSPTRQLWAPDIVPVGGDMSLLCVGTAGTNDNARLVGAALAGQLSSYISHVSQTAAAYAFRSYVNYVEGGNATSYSAGAAGAYDSANGPFLSYLSHAPGAATRRTVIGVNDSDVGAANTTGSSTPNACSELHVGGVNPYGDAILGSIDNNGYVAEVMVFECALDLEPGLLATAKRYANERYALW